MRIHSWLAVATAALATTVAAQQMPSGQDQQPKGKSEAVASKPSAKGTRMLADPAARPPSTPKKPRGSQKPVEIPQEPKPGGP